MEQEKPRPDPAPEPVIRDDVRVEGAPVRCPFCHTDVDVDGAWSACARCLGRHHAGCWQEGARCGACGHDEAVHHAARTEAPARPGRGRAVAIVALAAVAAVGVAMLVAIGAYSSQRVAPRPGAARVEREQLTRPPASRGMAGDVLQVHDGRGNVALLFEAEGAVLFGLDVELRLLDHERAGLYHGGGHTTYYWRSTLARSAQQNGRPLSIQTRERGREGVSCRVPFAELVAALRDTPLEGLDLAELARRVDVGD